MRRNRDARFITARFQSVCPETGKTIEKGTGCVYLPHERKAYHIDSTVADALRAIEFSRSWGMADANY